MAGVGKLIKQAAKMQKQIETVQAALEARRIEVTRGGGAVRIAISGQGTFLDLKLDPEFLKEDATVVGDTILDAVRDAAAQAKAVGGEEMRKATAGFSLPGLM